MKKGIITIFVLAVSILSFGQKDVDVNYMLRGSIYASSSITDSDALGGFGGSSNAPLAMGEKFDSETDLFIRIDTTKMISIVEKRNGYTLYIGNRKNSIVALAASDSRLSVTAEVYYGKKWQPIEYLPSSWCGNSYHTVYLNPNEYWSFIVPKFVGKIETKLRYKLDTGKDGIIYSNEIKASFNKGQLSDKEGHIPNGIMDPYND